MVGILKRLSCKEVSIIDYEIKLLWKFSSFCNEEEESWNISKGEKNETVVSVIYMGEVTEVEKANFIL